MLRYICAALLVLVASIPAFAENIGGNRTGTQLISFLRANFRPTTSLSYDRARQKMFGEIDNRSGKVRCAYTGVEITTAGIPDPDVMNTEHTWPQSLFDEDLPMKADLHHLFPTLNRPNGARSHFPFGEIPDNTTTGWWRSNTKETQTPATGVIDQFSESIANKFEPREDHKGNAARAMFYFWVVYGDKDVTPGFMTSQLSILAAWHVKDPVDATEQSRNTKINAFQGNANPFVLDPTLVARILNPVAPSFSAEASPSDVTEKSTTTHTAPSACSTAKVCCCRRQHRRARRCR
jgi:hypothetical protein